MKRARAPIALIVFSLTATIAACGGSDERESATFKVTPGWEQVLVTDAVPGDSLSLVADGTEDALQTTVVDAEGVALFRRVDAGSYAVLSDGSGKSQSDAVTVKDESETPDASFYSSQDLTAPGFGYVTTRDGTTLSINVSLPGPAASGPYPTVVEYSGYSPSNPSDTTSAQLYNALGYAYVGANMRGTGCSGGSFRFFELMQRLDAYDLIEVVAAQPWVKFNKVGMVGISYPGISQLFAASTQPPSLAAITPLSVLDDSYRATLYPGGILNTGFAVKWTSERVEQSKPLGQGWEQKQIDSGDTTCADNQKIRGQNPDLLKEIEDNPYYSEELGSEINPRSFIGSINVPVFIAGAWQDEQTGGRFATMLDQFTSSPQVYAYLTNGLHTESLISTGILPRMSEFLDLYVARKVPSLTQAKLTSTLVAAAIVGVPGADLGADRFKDMSYEEALAAYESGPKVNVLFEEGAADGVAPGAASPRWISSFDSWPIPTAKPLRLYASEGGRLGVAEPTVAEGSDDYRADPTSTDATYLGGDRGDIWKASVKWEWDVNAPGTAAVYTTDALLDDTVIIGSSSADLWISSTAPDTDLEVTVSEVRPDGNEVYVQSGWLRASHRAVDEAASSELLPVHRHLESDAQKLESGVWELARVEIFPVAHAFRKGSKIRVSIDAPGGNRAEWEFRTIANGETVSIARNSVHPTSFVFPVVAGIEVPASLPTCSLRGQPCRKAS